MKKEKNKKLIIGIVIVSILLIIGIIYFIINSKGKNILTLEENKWIDSNKYDVIDMAVISDIPSLSYDGKGFFYDYIDYVNKQTSLQFNIIPYKLDTTVDYEYKVDLVDLVSNDDLILHKDDLVLITKDNREYYDLDEIKELNIGVLSSDKELINKYITDNNIIEYESYTKLKEGFDDSEDTINSIIIPKLIYTKEIIQQDYKISYCFNDINKYFVLKANGNKLLNSILKKNFNNWKELNYIDSYNSNLLNNYYSFKGITDTEQKKLQSKNYNYGFIDYGIYNNLDSNKISGFNELVLKDFNKFSGLSIKYTKYSNISRLLKDFNSKKIDFIMNIASDNNYGDNIFATKGFLDKNLVIISGISNKDVITSIYSLKDKEVSTIKDSYLEKYLIDNNIKVKSYANMKDLTTDFTKDDIVLIDTENYNYYKTSSFKDSKINYILNMSDKYNYIINDTDDNSVFKDIFNFYINYNSSKELISNNYEDIAYKNKDIVYMLILIIIVLLVYLVVDFSNHVKIMISKIKKNKKINLTKEEKIKYIDQLTSLKNRAYLNSRIEAWDESEIYPQAIIIIDLNNISYINDNYGREEGDKVITEAANILIQHQLQNSEIIRTDGNEFLVYLVGYNEKQIISYLRKLTKELKGLSHGFGAASGYSIITDAIKTFDDAVNEATLDMKNNKEDIDY